MDPACSQQSRRGFPLEITTYKPESAKVVNAFKEFFDVKQDEDGCSINLEYIDSSLIRPVRILITVPVLRLGADVQNAVEGVILKPDIIVVMHHKDVHAQPHELSSNKLFNSPFRGGTFTVTHDNVIDGAYLNTVGV